MTLKYIICIMRFMHINKYGEVFLNLEEVFENLYSGKIKNFQNIVLDNAVVDQFNNAVDANKDDFGRLATYRPPTEDVDLFDEANQCTWFMPDEYITSNLVDELYNKCTTQDQKNRVDQELELFIQHGMFDMLFYLKYLVDTMRANNIVWGVGRGSSVASYVLFLMGVHKIDSLKFNLDIHEFLK